MKIAQLTQLATTYSGYMHRIEQCGYPPTRVWVEPTSDCNLRCSFCMNRELQSSDRGHMDMDLFRSIADQASGKVRQFNLFHRGEALLHPHIVDMVEYTAKKGIRSRLHTNGTMLRPELARSLIEAGLDVVSFSFDGYDREMYEANRPNARFDSVLGNILALLHTKKRLGVDRPFVAIELMEIASYTHDEMLRKRQAFLKQFEGLPLDKFILRKPHNWGGLVDTEGMGAKPPRNPRVIPCPLLWHALVVFWDGRVLPCPQDFFGGLVLGDLNRESLLDVWNGDAIRALRREMANPESVARKPCSACDRIVRATFAGVPTDYLGRFVSETISGNSWISRILPH